MRKKEIGSVARGFLVLVLLPTLVMAGCGKKEGRSGNQARESTPAASAEGAPCQASEEVAAALPRVVDLGRGICIPCKQMAPILKELAETYKGRTGGDSA
jgi:thiol-disulfide isomerase/thioredoxin